MEINRGLGMYFVAAVVFVTKSSLLFRLAVAILWKQISNFGNLDNAKNYVFRTMYPSFNHCG